MRRILILAAALLGGCGSGTLSDIWHAFPPEVFEPPGGGGGGGGGTFTPREVAALDDAQGVTGDVRNLALAQAGAQTLAFLAAGTAGVHVVDVTNPSTISSTSFLDTIDGAHLTAPAEIAGGRVDAITVIADAYLVCAAVGAEDATGNSVTIFHIPTLQTILSGPEPRDFSAALVSLVGPGISVPGTAAKKAGGVSGANVGAAFFLVATGGPSIGIGVITPGTPGTWASAPAFTPAAPAVLRFFDVKVGSTGAVASVQGASGFGILGLTITPGAPPTLTPAPSITSVAGAFASYETDPIAGPGNYPLDLALDGSALYVTADNRVQPFAFVNPLAPSALALIDGTGGDTIAVDAAQSTVAVGAGTVVRVYGVVSGVAGAQLASVTFSAPATIRGVALRTAANGSFVLCCAGSRGFRIVQWRKTSP